MASESSIRRCRKWYARLLRLYPKPYRERFGEGMEQTFNDLCRDRIRSGKGMLRLTLWVFFETAAGIFRENVTRIMTHSMKEGSITFLKFVKYSGIAVSALMVSGIVALMILARGKGEDITGIVAPALLLTFVSGIAAIVASILQRRAQRAVDVEGKGLS